MAKIDLSKYFDEGLRDEFESKPYDASKARKPLLTGIERTIKQFNSSTPSKAPNKWYKVNGKAVELRVKVGNQTLPLGSKDANLIATDRFPAFLADFMLAVEAGDYDADLERLSKTAAIAASVKPSTKSGEPKDKFPKHLRSDWDSLSRGDKQSIGSLWSRGKNPDHSERSEVGDKPDAKYAGPAKK
jgi:hypothetical protein